MYRKKFWRAFSRRFLVHKGRADEAKSAATSSIKPKIWSLAATAISDKPKSPFSSSTSSTSSPPMAQLSQLPLSVHAAPSAFTPTATGNLSSWYYHPAVSLNHRTVPGYTSSNSYGTNYGMVLPRNPHQTSPLPPSGKRRILSHSRFLQSAAKFV